MKQQTDGVGACTGQILGSACNGISDAQIISPFIELFYYKYSCLRLLSSIEQTLFINHAQGNC